MPQSPVLAAALAFALCAGGADAEDWPDRPLGFVQLAPPQAEVPVHPCRWHVAGCLPHRTFWAIRAAPPPVPRGPTLDEARALLDAGQAEAARDVLLDLTRLSPQDPALWTLMGRAERRLGRLAAAGESLRRALELDAGHPGALVELGFLSLARGEPARAFAALAVLSQGCATCAETVTLRSALTGAGYHEGVTGPKRIRVQP